MFNAIPSALAAELLLLFTSHARKLQIMDCVDPFEWEQKQCKTKMRYSLFMRSH